MGNKEHILENITAGMISIWFIDNLGKKRGTDSKASSDGEMSITGGVGINLVHMLKHTRNIMVFYDLS